MKKKKLKKKIDKAFESLIDLLNDYWDLYLDAEGYGREEIINGKFKSLQQEVERLGDDIDSLMEKKITGSEK